MINDEEKYSKARRDRLIYEITTSLNEQFANSLLQRDSLIEELSNLPKDLQIKTIIDIWREDNELKKIRDKHIQIVGIKKISNQMKKWQPFGGEERFKKYNLHYNDYYGRFISGISLFDHFVEDIIVGNDIQGKSWTSDKYNSWEEALSDILTKDIEHDTTNTSNQGNIKYD